MGQHPVHAGRSSSQQKSQHRPHPRGTLHWLSKALKRYKILGNKVVAKMLPYLSDIAFVCAQLVNLNPVFLREVDTDFF